MVYNDTVKKNSILNKIKDNLSRRNGMAEVNTFPIDDGGLEDMADIDTDLPTPSSWNPEEDNSEFKVRDRDDDANG